MAANFSPEGDGLSGEGWNIKPEVIATICTEFSEALFEAVVNTSRRKSRIFRLIPDCQMDVWQLVSVNINRQRSLDISTIKEKLLGPAHARTHTPAILSIQETKSWDVPNLDLSGYVCYGSKSWFRNIVGSKTVLHNIEIMEV